ncbi:10638_t:CDS:1 [Paraglomus occultum]|uniref:10638_t:CDS:1 n=1 Tax=Paraglomus occultum TaxID=144539 RepID=A0A9N8WPA0_9GLOM|nr:10638_t:CDS:1 [Paraglomus occultum]
MSEDGQSTNSKTDDIKNTDTNKTRSPERRSRPRPSRSSSLDSSYEIVPSTGTELSDEGLTKPLAGKPSPYKRNHHSRHGSLHSFAESIPSSPLKHELTLNTSPTQIDEGDDYESIPSPAHTESNEDRNDDDKDNEVDRLGDLNLHQFGFPTNFRLLYVGYAANEQLKDDVFQKVSEALSQIFWEEADRNLHPTADVRPEKRIVICPVTNYPDNGKPEVEFYQDSGVAVSEADFTNRKLREILDYLENQFAKKENDDDLVDLCFYFLPPDEKKIPSDLWTTMKKLQEKVTLVPLRTAAPDELSTTRQTLLHSLKQNDIDIFIWKDDKLVQKWDEKTGRHKWFKTVFTRTLLTVEEFAELDIEAMFEDLRLIRSRALEFRKEREKREIVQRRIRSVERLVEFVRSFLMMVFVLGVAYFFFLSMWTYGEFSVIPEDIRESLQVVSSATSRLQQDYSWQYADTFGIDDSQHSRLVEVYQVSRSRFVIDTYDRKQTSRGVTRAYEAIVLHNAKVLRRHDVAGIGDGRYSFDIDTSDAIGSVYVAVRDKNGEIVRVVPWLNHKMIEQARQPNTPSARNADNSPQNYYGYGAMSSQVVRHAQQMYSMSLSVGGQLADNAKNLFIYTKKKADHLVAYITEELNEWVPYIWDQITYWASSAKEKAKRGAGKIKRYVASKADF